MDNISVACEDKKKYTDAIDNDPTRQNLKFYWVHVKLHSLVD